MADSRLTVTGRGQTLSRSTCTKRVFRERSYADGEVLPKPVDCSVVGDRETRRRDNADRDAREVVLQCSPALCAHMDCPDPIPAEAPSAAVVNYSIPVRERL